MSTLLKKKCSGCGRGSKEKVGVMHLFGKFHACEECFTSAMKLGNKLRRKIDTYPIATASEDINTGDAIEIDMVTGMARKWRGK